MFINMWLQLHSAYYYKFVNDLLTYPVILLSSFCSITLFASDDIQIKFVIALLSSINVILTGILIELNPGQRMEQYMGITKRYSTLIRSIDFCLSMPSHMREDPKDIIDKFGSEFDNLAEGDLIVPKYVLFRFRIKYGDVDKLRYGEEIIDLLTEDMAVVTYIEKRIKSKIKNALHAVSAVSMAGVPGMPGMPSMSCMPGRGQT